MSRKSRKRIRRVYIQDKEYKYKIAKSNTIIIYLSESTTHYVLPHIIVGNSPDDFDRGQRGKTSDGMVTPALVAKYITKLLKKEVTNGNRNSI